MAEQSDRPKMIAGLVVSGGVVVGIVSLIAAFLAFLTAKFIAAAICLVAAALAFGLIANAVLRD